MTQECHRLVQFAWKVGHPLRVEVGNVSLIDQYLNLILNRPMVVS